MSAEWDFDDLQNAEGKTYQLRFLPYLETPDGKDAKLTIGYEPDWVRRGYGYGRWEEFFHTLPQAQKRMENLIASGAIEDIELRQAIPGQGMVSSTIAFWADPPRTPKESESE